MKKICSIICAVSLMLSAIIVPVSAAQSKDEVKQQQNELLYQLGIANSAMQGRASLTRIQAVDMALAAAGANLQSATGLFTDVAPGSSYAASVETAYRMGLVNGYPDGTFRPDAGVSYGEMVKIMLSVCGYSGYAQMRGGYPVGYLQTAREERLLNNVRLDSAEQLLTVQEGMTLVYNALHIDLMVLDTVGANESGYKIRKGYNLLERVFKIEVVNGIVTANMLTSLYDASGTVASGLAVDGRIMSADSKWGRYLGYRADVYVDDSETVCCVIPTKHNRTVSYLGDDTVKADNVSVEAYVGNPESVQRFKLAEGASYFKNGVYVASFGTQIVTPDELCKPNVRYVLLDNNDDGVYDCIFAEVYEYFQVKSVDLGKRWIYNKIDGKTIELEDGDTFAYLDGRELPLDKLQYNSVVGVRLPDGVTLDDERDYALEFVVVDGVVSGNATVNGSGVVYISGMEYEINPAYGLNEDNIGGKSGSFYLDACGKLLFHESYDVGAENRYAYISKLLADPDDEDVCRAKILLQNEGYCIKEISSGAALVMDGEAVTSGGKAVKGPRDMYAAKDMITDKIIKVQINVEGKISRIELASMIPAEERGEDNDFNYTPAKEYKTRGIILDDIYRLPKSATVFTVPEDGVDEKIFRISTLEEISKDEKFTCEIYEIDRSYTAHLALVRQADASQAKVSSEDSIFVVKSVGTALNSEGYVTVCVTGIQSGTEKKIIFRDADAKARDWLNNPTGVRPVRRDIRADQLKFGDIIQYTMTDGEVQAFRAMYLNPKYNEQGELIRGDGEFAHQGSDDYEEIFEWAGLQWPFVVKSMLFVNGKVTLKDSEFFSMDIKGYKKNVFESGVGNVYYVAGDNKNVRAISFNDPDFTAGKRVFVTFVWGKERDVVVYE